MYFRDFKLEAVNTVKRFSNFGFPYVIAPAFSTPAFSTPAFSAPPCLMLKSILSFIIDLESRSVDRYMCVFHAITDCYSQVLVLLRMHIC